MKIYAIRDRLVDYFMTPFAAPETKPVMAALATTINSGDHSDIATNPHHFELWQLGQVQEDGHITPSREFICDLSSLIRPGVRPRRAGEGHQSLGADEATGAVPEVPGGAERPGGTLNGSIPSPAPPTEVPADEVRRGPQGGYPPRELFHPDQPHHYVENGQVKTDL